MKNTLLFRMVVLVAAVMCALGVSAQEAYAVYTTDNTTLTFYYDTLREFRTGTTYDLNEGADNPEWKNDGTNVNVTRVVFDPSFIGARPSSTHAWFDEMHHLSSITGMEYLNTSEVTNMAYMFSDCGLTSLDLSHFNTSKVTIMHDMFEFSHGLTSLDLSRFNTSRVTNMEDMFAECISLQTIYVGSGWNTTAVEISRWMFTDCNSLVGGMGTTWDEGNPDDKTYAHIDGGPNNPGYFTEKVLAPEAYACYTPENTTFTFYYDNQRDSRTGTTYDLNTAEDNPGWYSDGTNVNVTKVVFDPSFADARPTATYGWFYKMESLQSITGMEYLNTSEVTDMTWMFAYCKSLTRLDVSHFNTSKVTAMDGMFNLCRGLTSLDLSSFNTSKVTEMVTCSQTATICKPSMLAVAGTPVP